MFVKHRRLVLIITSSSLAIFCGWLLIGTLGHDCNNLSQTECRFLRSTAIASMLGGALLLEILITRKKARGEWQINAEDLHSKGPTLTSSQVWFRSIVRVILASLLTGLPLIAKGTFGLIVFGTLVGLSLAMLVRGIMNWLPPIEKDTDI